MREVSTPQVQMASLCLKACGDQLARILTQIFLLFLVYLRCSPSCSFLTRTDKTQQIQSLHICVHKKKCRPTKSTSQAPCWFPCSLPTGQTRWLMKQSLWHCTLSCNISIACRVTVCKVSSWNSPAQRTQCLPGSTCGSKPP